MKSGARRYGKRNALIVLLIIICLGTFSGCSVNRWGEVTAGMYTPVHSFVNGAVQTTTLGLDVVFVDREHQTAWIMFDNAMVRIISFVARPKKAWPSGCPTNLGSTYMETLDLDIEQLELGEGIIQNPILVRDCPPDPVELVLRDDGDIGGGGMACIGASVCVVFETSSRSLTLPQSLKGYELYSWHVGEDDVWFYTLMTGTNRPKTWEEISTLDSVLTEQDWIKITVEGEAALKSVLDRLPGGETVLWIGPTAPQATGTLGEHIGFPDEAVLREIEAYGQQRSIDLRPPPE